MIPSAQAAEPVDPGSWALRRLEALERRVRNPSELLFRNLSRYFVRYPVPEDPDGLALFLAELELTTAEMISSTLESAAGPRNDGDRDPVGRDEIDAVLGATLPSTPNAYSELVVFPDSGHPIPIEIADLEAFGATGLPFHALLAATSMETGEIPLTSGAAESLVRGANLYGLLLLRLAGHHARETLASATEPEEIEWAAGVLADGSRAELETPPEPPAPGEPEVFTDVTAEAGIRFRHVSTSWLSRLRRFGPPAPSFSGGGAAAGDVDGDGRDDLVLCGGRGCRLFLASPTGISFRERTGPAGVQVEGEARMPLLADLDGDGDLDLFVTYARDPNRLFRNEGDGTFRDATRGSGLGATGDISGPAVAFDADGDGRLDLYVGNFGNYLAGETPWGSRAARNGMPNRLYRNLGRMRFEDVTAEAGVGDTGWAQAVSHADYDLDGDQDLYVANDFGPNELFENEGDFRFRPVGRSTGSDDRFHGMNVSFADLDRDRRPDIFVTNIWFRDANTGETIERNTLLLSETGPDGELVYREAQSGDLVEVDSGWAWAAIFLDLDLDGDEDLFVANGFTDYLTFAQLRPHPDDPSRSYTINNSRESNLLFRRDDGAFSVVRGHGAEMRESNSRAAVPLDLDLDGDLDLAVTAFHDEARIFRNDAERAGGWLQVELEADPGSGVDTEGIGSVLVVEDEGLYVWRSVTGGQGYLGSSSGPIHLGLGDRPAADLEITWPDGFRQRLRALPAGHRVVHRLHPP